MARSTRRSTPSAEPISLDEEQKDVFARFLPKAALLLLDRARLFRVLRGSLAKVQAEGGAARIREDVGTMARFVAAFASKKYRATPWRSVVYVLAALLYFVSPLDLIPDWIPMLGLTDDVAVVFAVLAAVRKDLAAFTRWEAERGRRVQIPNAEDAEDATVVRSAPRRRARS